MSGLSDTDPQAREVQLELIRKLPPWRKFQLVVELNEMTRLFMLAGIRSRHPEADETEVRRRLSDLLLGPELAAKVYGEPAYDNVEWPNMDSYERR